MPSLCNQPFTQLKIQMDGKVYACSQGQLIGNINDDSIEAIWNGNKILELRKRLTEDKYDAMCTNCPLFNNRKKREIINFESDFLKIKKIENKFFIGKKELNYKKTSISSLDRVSLDRDGTIIIGWSVDAENNNCIDKVLMFINGKLEASAETLIPREDVALALNNKELTNSGFFITHSFISIEKKIELILLNNEEIIGVINVR